MAKQKNTFNKRAFQNAYTENYGRKRSIDDFYEELDDQEDFVDENNPDDPEDKMEEELKEENEDED